MYGTGLFKGLQVTLQHFVDTWLSDLKWLGNRYSTRTFALRQGTETRGAFTVEYPDEKLATPERFRFVPFLVVNNYDDPYAPGDDWCTSCGICAKVCPPQCIWIVRGTDPVTGRPKPQPEAFYIDIDICMNCGYCAEYCPFDAIKMDHDYELASYDRTTAHIHDKKQLSKEFRYWQTIAPTASGKKPRPVATGSTRTLKNWPRRPGSRCQSPPKPTSNAQQPCCPKTSRKPRQPQRRWRRGLPQWQRLPQSMPKS
ncbi:MAG: 4Fe-4S binding protein [Anaerolineae bacterium]|nr:4Fe-4S binding protein [Anaerolineae bacterium]